MSKFTCFSCSKEVDMKYGVRGRVICPYCGSRLLIKGRTGNPKLVKAR